MDNLVTRTVEIPSTDDTTPAYYAAPGDSEAHPGVILLSDGWGLVPHIADVARRLARAGFVACAPDLDNGLPVGVPEDKRKEAMRLLWPQSVRAVSGAARYLAALPNVAPKRVGLIGWGMGGALAYSVAAQDEQRLFGAVVAFYGQPQTEQEGQSIRAPLLVHLAGEEQTVGAARVRELDAALTAEHVPHQLQIIAGVSHAFFDDTRPTYRPQAAQAAWRQTLGWLHTYLK